MFKFVDDMTMDERRNLVKSMHPTRYSWGLTVDKMSDERVTAVLKKYLGQV